ncbi:MAG: hypothetical protein IPN15_08885 [Saprospiraceae bacterium]|nr:hypothetical protein [Candidatus Vicinibacter affinis]MBK8642309.1 hypothetical protein [Candidatus Vicinibacter affinis]
MTQSNENLFIKGFNQGYLLAQYEPDLLTSLLKNINQVNSYLSGLSFGQKEFVIEQATSEIYKLRNSKKIEKESREFY